MLKSKKIYFSTHEKMCQYRLNREMYDLVKSLDKQYKRIAVVGIGTDRSTGDSYGPLVGYMLSKSQIYDFDVYGTIIEPVHALNLKETMDKIDTSNTLVIAVDASIGRIDHIGHIGLCNEPIKPGSGVGKDLPPVGDISLSGIVAFGGIAPHVMLQNTSLGLVYKMAEITSNAIKYVLYKQQLEPQRNAKLNTFATA
ncbi:spore protease YyaC [Acetivibrio mesophilus]|uniref:Spore protease YyaC n=1 Tax=Acetivibrio mesophilus TaxID=2487273 RepID=A0A4V1K1T4_9FIRM|nr:spore protease YyaC [Acetivibrio mesophilus]ODM27867.1 spore protease YyaC [Clostridium sp. Bc-iso-3]RXE57899.1 spore protease YyaC [Acetivibrio mesophilus]HHV29973.1 spore protease YyaC [Clostridium sp.]